MTDSPLAPIPVEHILLPADLDGSHGRNRAIDRIAQIAASNDLQAIHAWLARFIDTKTLDAVDVLRATFPAGTVSGAPKVRAMEIIDELEPVKRGVYAGSVGYLGFNGDMDLAIAIRTAVLKDGQLHVQAGAGIVADSNPQAEWDETF